MTALRARELGKRFGPRIIFRQLELSVEGGSSLAVTGSNGSGKSTLVRILAGLMRPTRGEVDLTVDGQRVERNQRPFFSGVVAPYLDVYERFTPQENLGFICRARLLPDAAQRIEAVLERVGLTGREHDLVSTFSSGMKQRVRLAAALLTDPPLMLLDEPTSNLDTRGVQVVRGIMDECVREGRILVVATNDPAEAALCGRQLSILDFQ